MVRAFSKFEERPLETQGVLTFLVNPFIGNMDLIPPGSFEPDPPSTRLDISFKTEMDNTEEM